MVSIVMRWEFPTLTKQDLIDLVVARDASEDEVPIAAENVKPVHVLDVVGILTLDGVEVIHYTGWEE
jgi:hypothetical protein